MSSIIAAGPKVGGGILVDIASVSSRIFWLVANSVGQAPQGLNLPGGLFMSFAAAMRARSLIDSSPPLEQHPQGAVELGQPVVVDGVGRGRIAWIHPSGDVRVEMDREPGSAHYYPIAAVRRAVNAGSLAGFEIIPMGLTAANQEIERLHRRLGPVQGYKFGVGLRRRDDGRIAGVAVCARPVAKHLDDGLTAEVRRVAVDPSVINGCTKLLGAVARTAGGMGYRQLYTYVAKDQHGASLKAAGWECLGESKGGHWGSKSRPRDLGVDEGPKMVWRKVLVDDLRRV